MDLEQLIFNMYKDINFTKKTKSEIVKKYKLKNTQISNIRAKIIKYQIEKYGGSLGIDNGYKTKEDCKYLSAVSNRRKNERKNYDRKVR